MVDVQERIAVEPATDAERPAPGGEELHQQQVETLAGAVKASLDNAHLVATQYFDAIAEMQRQLAVLLWRGAPLPGVAPDVNGVIDLMKRSFDMSCQQSIALMDAATKAQLDFGLRVAEMFQAWPAGMAAPPPSKGRK